MATVTIEQYGGGRKIRLTAAQTRLFTRELARVRRSQKPGHKAPNPRIAPDCTITVASGGRRTVYLLAARAVLVQPRLKRTWQFYFGLLLLEWLHR